MPRFALPTLALAAVFAPFALAGDADAPDIPFKKEVLGNGLRVIVHEDHATPIVAVSVWYHVGSKDEKPGRTGFAHLFEHLMFNGSEHADTDWFKPMNAMGATSLNGTTSEDRTNYFQTVPVGAFDAVLWLESDRMGHLLGAIGQGKLDEQRGVVQNEKRQGENQPYSTAARLFPSLAFPPGHPYSWQVIGSMEDLNAASLDDVKDWFRAYYGAANAVVVICGDVDTNEAMKKVATYFGDVPPGPPVARPGTFVAKRTGSRRHVVEERVAAGQVTVTWNTAPYGTRDAALLDLAAAVLGRGRGSRLASRLVRQDGLATDVSADQDSREIAGVFDVTATAAPGADATLVEKALREELARFLADGPTAEELAIEAANARAEFVRRTERLGGFGGRTALLAQGELFAGRPDAWRARLDTMTSATPDEVRDAARRWLADGDLVIETRPFGSLAPAKTGADRARMPAVEPAAPARFPVLVRTKLENGLTVIAAPRPGARLARLDLVVGAGFASDPQGAAGAARLTSSLIGRGTTTRGADQVERDFERVGAEFETSVDADAARVSVAVPRQGLAAAAKLFADVVLAPAFAEDEIATGRREQLADVRRERLDARGILQRVLPALLYGEGHPYAAPWSGSGTEESVVKLGRGPVEAFYRSRYAPENATLIVSGDVTAESARALAADAFGAWGPGGAKAVAVGPGAPPPATPRVILVDRPGAPQSLVAAAQLVPARADGGDLALDVVNAVLGGGFVSRLNMNLREDKHWSYGARSSIRATRGPRALVASAPVQTDRTAESLAEMAKEIAAIAGGRPVDASELATARAAMTLTLPGRWEALRAVADSVAEIVVFGLPDDHFAGHAARIAALTEADVAAAAKAVHPGAVWYVVIGDRRKVEAPVRALGLGAVTVVDADGRPVE